MISFFTCFTGSDAAESTRLSNGLAPKVNSKTGKPGSVSGVDRGSKVGSRVTSSLSLFLVYLVLV